MITVITVAACILLAGVVAGLPGCIAVATACILATDVPGITEEQAAITSLVTVLLVGTVARLVRLTSFREEK